MEDWLSAPASKSEDVFARPSCTTCDLNMRRTRAEPHAVLPAYDVWSFKCSICKETKELTLDRWSKTLPP
jgi:hypothetical protein